MTSFPRVFAEEADVALWGEWYFGTTASDSVSYRTGHSDVNTRQQFIDHGRLDNKMSTSFRSTNDSWPVFAFSHSLGSVTSQKLVLFTIGLAQQQVINFQGCIAMNGPEPLVAYWSTVYNTSVECLAAFHSGWDVESRDALMLDFKIQSDSYDIGGQNYASLTTLVVRQTFGSLQVAHGLLNRTYLFIKEISSDGDIQTVDVIFPAHPIFLYLNPKLLKLLLEPLYHHQWCRRYPNKWAMHDLGSFPNAIGHPNGKDEAMPIEECSDMIIMTLAYVLRSGNSDYINMHQTQLLQWARFLADDSLIPAYQLSTDDFAGALANQTNLALKGIIGLRAVVEMAGIGSIDIPDWVYYSQVREKSARYIQDWAMLGVNNASDPPHATLAYNLPDSYSLLYNLYADRLLGLDFVPKWVYTMQSNFYRTILDDYEYGIPLDSRRDWAKSDWQAFAAAVAEPDVQEAMHDQLARFVEETPTTRPLTDLYDVETGRFPTGGPSFINRPVLGGFFALLALPR
ncbi:hypothetical protein SEPCBS119000_004987 [Sporothrix epigloea]|uniref:Glutaminase GtaA n=1 Tax=Sporothrix epigloea TaxID=1892477 RepID=A0ABP0DYY4_9PEZI